MQACSSLLKDLVTDCLTSEAPDTKNAAVLGLGMNFIVEHLDAEANRSTRDGNAAGLDESYQSMMKSAVRILSGKRCVLKKTRKQRSSEHGDVGVLTTHPHHSRSMCECK